MPSLTTPRVTRIVAALAAVAGCARLGDLGRGAGARLAQDTARLAADDPGRAGSADVRAYGTVFWFEGEWVPVVVYRPAVMPVAQRAPAVVFLPGRFSPEDEYESYGRLLASRGFVVAVRGRYDWFHPDEVLVREARALGDWLARDPGVDPARMGVAGHSMGACDGIAAAGEDPRFRAVVAIEPNGPDTPRVAERVLPALRAPVLLVGATVAWRGAPICGPRATNYERYFAHAPPGTVQLELVGADHMQVMDWPDGFGMAMCRVGTADSATVRTLARRATAAFFAEHLQGAPHASLAVGAIARVRVKGAAPLPSPQHDAAATAGGVAAPGAARGG